MTDSPSLFEQALVASRQKDFASARVLLKQLLKQEPQNLNAWLLAAHVVESRSDAITCFQRALQIDPENAYARQKLSQLEGEFPSSDRLPSPPRVSQPQPENHPKPQTYNPPNTGLTSTDGLAIVPRPETSQLQTENRPQPQLATISTPDKTNNVQIGIFALVGLVIVCCLAIIGVAALGQGGGMAALGFPTPLPTPNSQTLFNVLYRNDQAATDENLAGYMATIHPDSFMYGATESTLRMVNSQYDLTYIFYNLKVISADANEAQLHFSLVTRKRSGPAFRDNIITGTVILRPDKGVWKIYSQTIEDTKYEN